jgi:hypothetical protein
MKNINLVRHLRSGINKKSTLLTRSKNDWDSIKSYPYNPVDEHVEPKDEDIVRELLDNNYYAFSYKARYADSHGDPDQFINYRRWQHLYTHPTEPFIGWTHGSVLVKYLYLLLPVGVFIFCYKIFPVRKFIYFILIYFNFNFSKIIK